MTKLVNLLGRKPASAAEKPSGSPEPEKSDIELDHELFFPLAAQLGQENETVRNLLIDAEHKISELDTIKRSIGKLVDPVSKTLRAFEEAKSDTGQNGQGSSDVGDRGKIHFKANVQRSTFNAQRPTSKDGCERAVVLFIERWTLRVGR